MVVIDVFQQHYQVNHLRLLQLPHLNKPSKFLLTRFQNSNNFSSISRRKPQTRFKLLKVKAMSLFSPNPVLNDITSTVITSGVALFCLQFWGEIAKRRIIKDQIFIRKCVHINIGLVFMLMWPLFSFRPQAAYLAALVPGVNIIRMLVLGLGLMKDESMVMSMTRSGDYRELLKGPLYYASTATLVSAVYWRTSPIAIAIICNLCAGDGLADIMGRRFGKKKLPHNRNKSYAGSIAMAIAGFLASVGYMHFFSQFGFIKESPSLVLGFLIVSLATTVVESLPISTEIDDNLTVPLTAALVGSLVL
ncbi:probable phytol kinase 2, chloroplastic [Papaver somniferum]|uniref:probable phytol kinase 2, chloroplastic n=1 Tax=Papaver somniferum TaxID=3469 RepID=UPI000E6F8B32|nr:probable phytol kinase 2, chloroplastic [Papaver somniferum]